MPRPPDYSRTLRGRRNMSLMSHRAGRQGRAGRSSRRALADWRSSFLFFPCHEQHRVLLERHCHSNDDSAEHFLEWRGNTRARRTRSRKEKRVTTCGVAVGCTKKLAPAACRRTRECAGLPGKCYRLTRVSSANQTNSSLNLDSQLQHVMFRIQCHVHRRLALE